VGLIAVGVEREGYYLLSLSHIRTGMARAVHGSALVAPKGFGVAATPWHAVQIAAWAALRTQNRQRDDYPRHGEAADTDAKERRIFEWLSMSVVIG
jgi:hypothetical protein